MSSYAVDKYEAEKSRYQGYRITMQNLSYELKTKRGPLRILDGINAYFQPGEMTALMGPSGSGKTTLLDLLAGRKTQGSITGDILFSGHKPSKAFLRRYTGYVEQFDTLLGILTVEEMLMYTAELKLPTSIPRDEKMRRVNQIIRRLGLEVCRNIRIGSALERGISGGQAKRVNIGVSLITEPRVLYLDEPTSGLDAFTSNEVMAVVKSVAMSGITVCATIHSPSEYTFRLFDRLLLLLNGKAIYFGDIGKVAVEFFTESKAAFKPFAKGDSEAEWIVDITTKAVRDKEAGKFIDYYERSDSYRENCTALAEYVAADIKTDDAEFQQALRSRRETETGFFKQLVTLFRYRTGKNYKNPAFVMQRVMDKVIIGLLIMSLFWGVGKNPTDPKQITNTAAVLFMWSAMPAFGAASYVPSLTLERKLFIRERNDGLYMVISYLTFKLVEELILAFAASIVVSAFVFAGVKLEGNFGMFWLQYILTLSLGIGLAYFFGSITPSVTAANAALPAFVVCNLFFAGFLMTRKQIPRGWKWFSYIDFITYGWGGLMVNQFEGSPSTLNGIPVLEFYGHPFVDKWAYTGILSVFFFVAAFFTWLALSYVRFDKR